MVQGGGHRETYSFVACGIAVIAFAYIVANIYLFINAMYHHDQLVTCIFLSNQLALWILPNAAYGLFVLIVVLHHFSSGGLTFEGLGFKFNGVTGPVLLWLLCFSVVGLVLKHAWHEMPWPKECAELKLPS